MRSEMAAATTLVGNAGSNILIGEDGFEFLHGAIGSEALNSCGLIECAGRHVLGRDTGFDRLGADRTNGVPISHKIADLHTGGAGGTACLRNAGVNLVPDLQDDIVCENTRIGRRPQHGDDMLQKASEFEGPVPFDLAACTSTVGIGVNQACALAGILVNVETTIAWVSRDLSVRPILGLRSADIRRAS